VTDTRVVIVGGGLAGLACTRRLAREGVSCTLLEASNRIGGRCGGADVDGYTLDRGFQVYLPAYPDAGRELDHAGLDLRPFHAGARIWTDSSWRYFIDPRKHPLTAAQHAALPAASLPDLLPLARFTLRVLRTPASELMNVPEGTTLETLHATGLSGRIIERFFRPFFGGVFFDRDLSTSGRMFLFTFRMFAEKGAALPAAGMQAIPEQLKRDLPAGCVRFFTPVESLDETGVRVPDEGRVEADAVVVATDQDTAARLVPRIRVRPWQSTATIYFSAGAPPFEEPLLALDGTGKGPVNHLAVPTNAAGGYAPPGKCLISANTVGIPEMGDPELESAVRRQLTGWFGPVVETWDHLVTYRIPNALPNQFPPALDPPERPVRVRRGLYVCGDHRSNASINGAIRSGVRAAEALIRDFGGNGSKKGETCVPSGEVLRKENQ
jgi:phytoene dehydrogenase-like protein